MGHQSVERPADAAVAELAGRQGGVAGAQQLSALGLTRKQVSLRVRRGWLHPLHRGVYAVGHRSITAVGRWHAAVLACGEGAVLSHRAAGSAWDLRPWGGGRIDVTVPKGGGRTGHDGLRIHRVPGLGERETTTRQHLRVTTVERTLFDLATVLRPRELEHTLERARHRGLVDHATLSAYAHRSAPGAPKLRRILTEPLTFTRSHLERRFLELVDRAGLEQPEVNHRLGPYECDFVWPRRRLIVETDGAEHRTRRAFEDDRRKDADLTTDGWRVVRLTHLRVEHEPAAVTRMLRALV